MASLAVTLEAVPVTQPEDMNVVIGQAHFIKTVEDLHEALAGVSPQLKFGLAFCEASAARLVRRSGNDAELTDLASANAIAIGAGHAFVILLREGFPINVLNPVGVETDTDAADRHTVCSAPSATSSEASRSPRLRGSAT